MSYEDGQPMLVLLSSCCGATMKGVEHGDHKACRKCKQTERNWVEYLAPFRNENHIIHNGEKLEVGAGPSYDERIPFDQIHFTVDYVFWG